MILISNNRKKIVRYILHSVFWVGYTVALLAFFEQCNDSGYPIWSSVLGFPFLHHGYYGFIVIAISYITIIVLRLKGEN